MAETLQTSDAAPRRQQPGTGPRGDGPVDDRPRWWHGTGGDAAIVAGLSLAFLVLFVVARQEPWHYDPIEYFFTAQSFESAAPFHRSLRIGLLGPIRFAQSLFGYSQTAYYAVPAASGVLLLGSTYVLGRVASSRAVGAAAGLLVVCTAPVFALVHQVWPDLPATALFTAAMAGTTVLARRHADDPDAVDAGWWYAGFALLGLVVGWSYLVREFTAVLFPVVAIPLVQHRVPWRYVLAGAAGALTAFGGELAFNATFHGDPLIRLRDLLAERGAAPPPHLLDQVAARSAARGGVLDQLAVLPGHLSSGRTPTLAVVGAAALASPLLVRTRRARRVVIMLLGWVLVYWGTVTYLALDVDQYGQALHTEKVRYWYPVLPPLVVAGCAAVAGLVRRLRTATLRHAALVVAGLAVLGTVALDVAPLTGDAADLSRTSDRSYEQLRSWLARDGGRYNSLATTQRTGWLLGVYTSGPFGDQVWDGRVLPVNTAREFLTRDRLDTELVLVDDTFFEARLSNWREVTPPWLLDLPDDWRPVFATDDGELIVHERGRAPIELAPTGGSWTSTAPLEGDDEMVRLAVADGDRADLGLTVDPSAAAGEVVLTELEVATAAGATGQGDVVPTCLLTDAAGERTRLDASSLWGVGFEGPRDAQFTCAVPSEANGPVDVQLVLRVTGPLVIEVADASTATVVPGGA